MRPTQSKNLLPYDGLRGWIEKLAEMGDLRIVEGADCQKDIGQATELLQHHPDAPAVLFDSIPGYKKGYRVLVNTLGTLGADRFDPRSANRSQEGRTQQSNSRHYRAQQRYSG